MGQEAPKIDWKEESRRFDGIAELYDACRPSYPNELIETVLSISKIRPGGRILEIGSGTGQASAPFARRGFTVLCIEPGRNLAAVAAEKFRGSPNVAFECVRFEDWTERPNEFDLVVSAQAFHWVPKDVGFAKAARALKEKGYLALFWNRYPGLDDELRSELDRVYQECAPELRTPSENLEEFVRRTGDEINESNCFEPVVTIKFPWSARYTTQQYLGLLNTYSDHLRMAENDRRALFAGIADVIDRRGGYLDVPYLAVLYMAEKRTTGP